MRYLNGTLGKLAIASAAFAGALLAQAALSLLAITFTEPRERERGLAVVPACERADCADACLVCGW